MSNDMLTREDAEAEVYKLAASVVEEPRRGGIARLLEKVAMQEQQAPLSAVLVERGALAVLEEARSRSAAPHGIEASDAELLRLLTVR